MKTSALIPIVVSTLAAFTFAQPPPPLRPAFPPPRPGERPPPPNPLHIPGAVVRGLIEGFTPQKRIVVRQESGSVPYEYSRTVTYVTRGGRVLTEEEITRRIREGVPVSVTYVTEGDRRVVTRVELDEEVPPPGGLRPPPPPPARVPGAIIRGVVEGFVPQKRIVVKEESGSVPYEYSKTVTYVTRSGRVLREEEVTRRVREGVPVSVTYIQDGEVRVVTRIEVDDD